MPCTAHCHRDYLGKFNLFISLYLNTHTPSVKVYVSRSDQTPRRYDENTLPCHPTAFLANSPSAPEPSIVHVGIPNRGWSMKHASRHDFDSLRVTDLLVRVNT
jgi:hypothetical protein